MTTAARMDELDREAARLRAEGAPGAAFERLARQGWTPLSQRAGNGLDPCPPECGVCFPTAEIRLRARRQRRRSR